MKKLSITALLIVSLFTAAPAAQAADWSNGEMSCDLNVTELDSWLHFGNWGKWQRFTAKLYKNQSPEKAVTYTCSAISPDNTEFGCTIPDNQIDTALFLKLDMLPLLTIKPGTSKGAACEIVLKAAKR